jgi:cytochrome c556
MKKLAILLALALVAATGLAPAAAEAQQELRPSQKLMQGRAAQVAAMTKNLEAKAFSAIGNDAAALAAEARKTGEGHPNPQGKAWTLDIAALADEISAAAAKEDSDTVKAKIGAIRAKCSECHNTLRPKK